MKAGKGGPLGPGPYVCRCVWQHAHWCDHVGSCWHAPQSGIRYPVVVRFENQNYAGVSTNNYALDEVKEAK